MSEPAVITVRKLAYSFARENAVILAALDGEAVPHIIHTDTAPLSALREARRIAGRPCTLQSVDSKTFERHLTRLYTSADLDETAQTAGADLQDLSSLALDVPETSDLLDVDEDAPIIRLLNGILQEALNRQASDIHIEPYEKDLKIRLRTDGMLTEMLSLPAHLSARLVSRVKVMSRLDISRKRLPQDGRFSFTLGARSVDVRVSTLPSRNGERVVMRILEKDESRLDVSRLNMPPSTQTAFEKALSAPNGIVLVTGPTGSGKTTTLYAALNRLHDGTRNILTVEDPIEYALAGVGQTQVNAQYDLTFASGLRAILRQDPDVVMIGEIRDSETAQIAIQAALTGHLVLSTIHTNSAAGAIARLRDLGAEPFLLASTLTAVMAQRLVRRLCEDCKQPYTPTPEQRAEIALPARGPLTVYAAKGCPACAQTGFKGRLGLFELMPINDTVRALIHEESSEDKIEASTRETTQSILSAGADAVLRGDTTIAEVLRVSRLRDE